MADAFDVWGVDAWGFHAWPWLRQRGHLPALRAAVDDTSGFTPQGCA